jgi:hypothetical protein
MLVIYCERLLSFTWIEDLHDWRSYLRDFFPNLLVVVVYGVHSGNSTEFLLMRDYNLILLTNEFGSGESLHVLVLTEVLWNDWNLCGEYLLSPSKEIKNLPLKIMLRPNNLLFFSALINSWMVIFHLWILIILMIFMIIDHFIIFDQIRQVNFTHMKI